MSKTFQSLKHYNFRLWFAGNVVASTGTWMQRVAQDWLVLIVLTEGQGFQVGVVTALQFLPMLLLSPWAGTLADRLDRRRLLQTTQIITGLLGLGLGVLVVTESAELWMVYGFALAGGVASAFDSPARQAFVSELVPIKSLPNAVGLNSTAFNTARLIGPAVSGFLIEWVGMGMVFIINAALFAFPVLTLALMRQEELRVPARVPRKKGQIREGFHYVRQRPDIIVILCIVGVVSAFGLNFQMTSAMMATEIFHRSAADYGALGSFMAIGSLAGSLLAARRNHPRLRLIVVSALAFGVCELALAFSPNYWTFALLCIPTGLTALTLITAANAAVQISTDQWIRGRVMALYSMIFLGSTPLGAPIIGWVGENIGARWSLIFGAIACVAVSLVVGFWGKVHWDIHLRLDPITHRIQAIGPVERSEAAAEADAKLTEEQQGGQADTDDESDRGDGPTEDSAGNQK